MAENTKRFPMKHVAGFVLSLILTVLAAWAAVGSEMPTIWIIVFIVALAVIQAGIQLFMFMHMTETVSGGGHVPWNMMFHGFVLAAIIIAGSLFTMSFGFSHDNGNSGNMDTEEMDH